MGANGTNVDEEKAAAIEEVKNLSPLARGYMEHIIAGSLTTIALAAGYGKSDDVDRAVKGLQEALIEIGFWPTLKMFRG